MRLFIATILLLWGSNALAATSVEPTAALVTGDIISAGLVVQSAEVVGLTDSGQLLTQGLASNNGQSVGFVALLDKNDQVKWSMSDGDTWPQGGIIANLRASQLLFDGSFLVHGTATGTSSRPMVYRVNPTGQASAVFDCEIPSLNEEFCAETTPPAPTHDMTGTVLLVAEDSAWRLANGAYHRVFDFQVGDELPLGLGTLVDGSCIDQTPITDWTLDGKGGVVAVVYGKSNEEPVGPSILRQSIEDEFSVDIGFVAQDPARLNRCGLQIYGADLLGIVFTEVTAQDDEAPYLQRHRLTDDDLQFISRIGELKGAVSGLYNVSSYGMGFQGFKWLSPWLNRDRVYGESNLMLRDFIVDVARGAASVGVLDLSDGSRILVSGTPNSLSPDVEVMAAGQEIAIRSASWTVADIKLTAFTSGLQAGSISSDGAFAFVISDVITGNIALMRVSSPYDFVVNSRRDSSTSTSDGCVTEAKAWDGRPECTVRAAVEASSTRANTSIILRLMDDTTILPKTPLHISTPVEITGHGRFLANESDLWIVQGGSLALTYVFLESISNCIAAEDVAFITITDSQLQECGGFGIRSLRSGPVTLVGADVEESQFGIYADGPTPSDGPLVSLLDSAVVLNQGGIYATGSITLKGDTDVGSNKSAGVTMDGLDSDILTLTSVNRYGQEGIPGIWQNSGPGIHTLRGKLHIDGHARFFDNRGYALDAAGPVEFTRAAEGLWVGKYSYYRTPCRDLRFVDLEPVFDIVPCTGNGIRLRSAQPTLIEGVTFKRLVGPAILADGPLTLRGLRMSDVDGPGVFSGYEGVGPAVTLGGGSVFSDVQGPAIQTTSGDVLVDGRFELDRANGGFDVGGNIVFSSPEPSLVRSVGGGPCKFWSPQRNRLVSKKCGFSPMISHATTGTNRFENVDFINNRGPAIWAQSTVELRQVAMVGNDGGVIASSPNDAIILHDDVRILGNQGPGLVAKRGNIKALAPFRVERNEGAGIIVQNGDFEFENDSDTPAKIHHNAFGEACAPVGDQEFYPVYDRCIRAGLFVPNGSVISSGIEVTENVGDGIAADQVDLLSSTVCGNSGAQIVSGTQVLDDVELCNKIIDRKSSDDEGCTSTPGLVSPMMLLGFLGFRRRRRRAKLSSKIDGTSAFT